MKTLFKTVMEELKKIPNIYVAENWGQLDLAQPPVTFPCILLDLGDMDYAQRGRLVQHGDGLLVLTLADTRTNEGHNAPPERLLEQEFALFDTINTINSLLHGKAEGEKNSILIRTKLQKKIRKDGIREFTIFYKFTYLDHSACIKYTPVPPLQLKIQMQK